MTSVKQIKNHTKSVMQLIILVENIKILIEFKSTSITEIFDIICNNESFNCLTFLGDLKIGVNDYHKTLEKVFSNKNLLYFFDCEDVEYMKGFFSMLGTSDVSGQVLNCDLYKKLFEKKYSQLFSNEKSKCRCIFTLTIGFGLLISIIII